MTKNKCKQLCMTAMILVACLWGAVPVAVASDGSLASNVISIFYIPVTKDACIPDDVEVCPEVAEPVTELGKNWGWIKGFPQFLHSAFTPEDEYVPERRSGEKRNPAWGWVKIDGTCTGRQRADYFSPELDMAPMKTSCQTKYEQRYVELALLYFDKVVCKSRQRKEPGFPKKLIYHLQEDSEAKLASAIQKRNYEPLRFAEHMAKPDGQRWLKKLNHVAREKYNVHWSTGYGDRMNSYFTPSGSKDRNFCPWAIHAGPVGCSLAAVVYETQGHDFQLVNKRGEALEVSEQNKVVRRQGSAHLLLSPNPALGSGRMKDHEVYQFQGIGGYCYSAGLRSDFVRARGKKLQGRKDIVSTAFEIFEVK